LSVARPFASEVPNRSLDFGLADDFNGLDMTFHVLPQ
jgi:hypothetical protein